MILFLEEENETDKKINKIKEVLTKEQAIKDKSLSKKSYLHKCYHDEKVQRPCKREAI